MPRTRRYREKRAEIKQRIESLEEVQPGRYAEVKELDDEIRRRCRQPGAINMLRFIMERERNPQPLPPDGITFRFNNAVRLREALTKRWGPDRWEAMIMGPPGKGPTDKQVAFVDLDSDSSHTVDLEELASSGRVCGHRLHQMAHERAERKEKKAAELKKARDLASQKARSLAEAQPIFGTPGTITSRLSPHSSVAIRRGVSKKLAELQAKGELQHEPTNKALRDILRMYPGETEVTHSKRLTLAIDSLRRSKALQEATNATFTRMEAEGFAKEGRPSHRRPLTDSEVLSVQQMWRVMHRPEEQVDPPMQAAVRDFLEQFPEGIKLPPVKLAHRPATLAAIVKAVRAANHAELENDKKELTASRQASLEKVWKPTGAALLIRVDPTPEAKKPEPTTPVHQTRSGALPPTPTTPKKAARKLASTMKAAPKIVTPTKAVPKKPSPSKPTGIKKAATPATPAGQRRSTRISAKGH